MIRHQQRLDRHPRELLQVLALLLMLGALLGVFAGCGGGDPHDGPDSPTDPGDDRNEPPGDTVDCSRSVASILQQIDQIVPYYIPTWEQIDCYVDDLVRLPYPATVVMVGRRPAQADSLTGPAEGQEGSAWEQILAYEDFLAQWPMAEVRAPVIPPPHTAPDGTSFYPYTDETWDQKLRSIAIEAVHAKQSGYRVRIAHFYPPLLNDEEHLWRLGAQDIDSPQSFLQWWNTHYIPERASLAEAAERVKAEIYMPWDIEPGQMVRAFGDGWIENLPVSEQVALAQTASDQLLAALRPIFSGTLSVIVYDRYSNGGEEWATLDFSGWDQINCVFFTEGDLATTELYLDQQLAGYMQIVQRAGKPWIAQEVTVRGDRHRMLLPPDVSFESIEEDIYRLVFDRLAAQPIPPVGIGVTVGYIETPAAEAYVQQKLTDVRANGF